MQVHAIIPFKPSNPKTRLSCVLDRNEREALARAMLDDVIGAVGAAGCRITLLCTEPFEHALAETVVLDGGLNEALNQVLSGIASPVLVIMSDLPLVNPGDVIQMLATGADVAIAPGRGGGTNAIFMRSPQTYHVDFYGASFLDHLRIAEENDLSCEVIDSFRLSTDVDEKEDIAEVLIHGNGMCRRFLEQSGFVLSIEEGRVGVKRNAHEQTL